MFLAILVIFGYTLFGKNLFTPSIIGSLLSFTSVLPEVSGTAVAFHIKSAYRVSITIRTD